VSTHPTSFREDAKQAAIDQWTADPCGAAEGEPGTREYFENLLARREGYAPWMDGVLGYGETRGLRVLDVGCGQGIDVARYAMAGAHPTGVDLTPRHVELARQHLAAMGLDGEVVTGDAEALDFEDDTFDRASSNGVLHHTPDISAALREIRRVLRPGGEARVILYNRQSIHYWVNHFLDRGLVQGLLFEERSMEGVLARSVERTSVDARPLVRVYSPRQVRRLMRRAGFERVSTQMRHFHPENTRLTGRLERRAKWIANPRLGDRVGRIAGWYVIGRGVSP
jgi:ubiquinone/menaquinone biosynthesis C-methylase UbiE